MPLEALEKRILSESDSKAEQIKGSAEEEAKKMVAEAKEKAKEIEKIAKADAEVEAARLEKEGQADIVREADAIILDARGDAVRNAAESVAKEIESMLQKEYLAAMLKSGIKQFSVASETKDFVVITSKKNSALVKKMGVSARYEDVDGFFVESKDGKVRLLISPDDIAEKHMDLINREVSSALFGGSPSSLRREADEKAEGAEEGCKEVG